MLAGLVFERLRPANGWTRPGSRHNAVVRVRACDSVRVWRCSPNGRIEAFVGPTELGAGATPSMQVIVDFIGGAEHSLDIARSRSGTTRRSRRRSSMPGCGHRGTLVLEQDYLLAAQGASWSPRAGADLVTARRRAQWEDRTGVQPAWRRIAACFPRCFAPVSTSGRPQPEHLPPEVHRARLPGRHASPPRRPDRVGQFHRHGHAPQPQPRLRLSRRAYICRTIRASSSSSAPGTFGRGKHGDSPEAFNLDGVR